MKMKVTAVPREIVNDLQYNLIDIKLLQRHVLDKSDFILLNSYPTNEEKVEILMELMRNKTEEDHNNFLDIMEEDYKWLRDKCEIFLQKIRIDVLLNGNQTRPVICESKNPASEDVPKETTSTEENDRSSTPECQSPSSPDSTAIPPYPIKIETPKKVEDVVVPIIENENLNKLITPEMMTVVRRNHRVVRKWSTLAHILGMSSIVHTLRMRMVINCEDSDACVLHLLEEWKGAHPKEATLRKLLSALREEHFNDVADELEEKFVT